MPRNVEIKARLHDPEVTLQLVAAAADGPPTPLAQADTFFRTAGGRLKLREFTDGTAELIHYERPDTTAPAGSRYAKVAVPDAAEARRLMERFGIGEGDLVAEAYVDLLERARPAAAGARR